MKKLFPFYVRIPVFFALGFALTEFFIDSGDRPAFLKYPLVSLFLLVLLVVIITVEVVVAAVDRVTYALLTEEQRKKLEEEEAVSITEKAWFKKLKGFFVTEQPRIEDEGTLMMDHNYDGIHELDNVLPPWWVKLFYGTIIFGAVYLGYYQIAAGNDQTSEFSNEMEEARIAVEEYKKTAKDLIDANTVTLLTDAGDLASGKKIFEANCIACHRADAGGAIGPNLTDNHWLLGGGIKNVFNTITKGGRDGKGMVAWQGTLKPSEIQLVASYILSLKGSNPKDAKAPEGDVYIEEAAPKAPGVAANIK